MMLLCPALTMRLYSEERKSGTWDILMVQRTPMRRIVTGKFFASWTLMLLALLPNVVHYFIVYAIAEPIGNIDGGQFAGSFIGLIMLSVTFLSIAMLAGCWTKNQIAAFISGALACFVLYWLILQHFYDSVSRGVIDLRDILVFVTIAMICHGGTIGILQLISHK